MIKIYILFVSLLLAFLLIPYIAKVIYLKKCSKSQKRYQFTSLWQLIDTFSETCFIKSLLLKEENKLYSNLNSFIAKNPYPRLSNTRLQTLGILSVIISFFLNLFIWINQSISIFLFNENLQKLATEIGNPDLAKISLPGMSIIIFSMISYFIPFIVFKMIFIVKGKNMESEALMLQSYAAMLLKTNTSIKYILAILLAQANYYKEPLRECLHLYTIDQKLAFERLKKQSSNIRFISVVNSLEKALYYDRKMAIKYLQNSKKLQTNLQKIEKHKKDKNKQLTGAILLIMPLIAFAFTAGYPWFLLVQKLLTNLSSL